MARLRGLLWVCIALAVGWVAFAGGLPSGAGWLVMLLCPLLHVVMMLGGRSCHSHGKESKEVEQDAVVGQKAPG